MVVLMADITVDRLVDMPKVGLMDALTAYS